MMFRSTYYLLSLNRKVKTTYTHTMDSEEADELVQHYFAGFHNQNLVPCQKLMSKKTMSW